MRPSIIRYTYSNIDKILNPMCSNCKYFSKELSSFDNKEHITMSTCTKFLIKFKNTSNHTLKDDYIEKHPYSLLARFDTTMCGLNGKYFITANK